MKKQQMRGAMNTKIKHHKAIDRKNMRDIVQKRANEYKFVGARKSEGNQPQTTLPTMRGEKDPL